MEISLLFELHEKLGNITSVKIMFKYDTQIRQRGYTNRIGVANLNLI